MHTTRYLITCVALVAVVLAMVGSPARAAADKVPAAETERQLIEVLQSETAPPQDKAITCKHLAIYGTKEAVPALAPLLLDEKLASWARIALEAIPGPEADAALRQALGKLDGRLAIGVINSIGVRRDAAASESLAGRLGDADAEVASAAAVALGHIGNASATQTLAKSLTGAPAAIRSAVAEGCILCAERLLAEGRASEAAKLYDQVRAADVPKQRVIEATRGAILARQADGIPLLVEQLRSDDKALFNIGLTTARELPGDGVGKALVAEMDKLSPQRRALLILALADRGDKAILPTVLESTTGGPSKVRVAALGVLHRLGDVSCVPTLLKVATDADANVAQAAVDTLAVLSDDKVSGDLSARLAEAKGPTRKVLITVVGRRRIEAAVPALLKAAEDDDAEIRTAALTALGSTVGPRELPVLIARVVAPQDPEETPVAENALRTACIRMSDRETCAETLAAAMSKAPITAKCSILEILGAMGGAKALKTVDAAARDSNEQLQDVASRLLGQWMSVDAAPVLLELAEIEGAKYKIRALRGYIRLVRQFNMPDEQRVAMCRAALGACRRDAEKKLVLEVMQRYPSIGMLKLANEAGKDPSLADAAAGVSLAIVQKIGGNSADVEKLLAQIGRKPVKLEIIKAEYGAGSKWKDVTRILRKHAGDLPLIVLPSSYNSSLGGDPVPGTVKQLKIQYRINGKAAEATFTENAMIMLATPK